MRTVLWSFAVIIGGWLVTMLGYTLIGTFATATAIAPAASPAGHGDLITIADVLSVGALLVLVTAAVWPGRVVAGVRARLAPTPAAVVGASGPLLAVALTLTVFLIGGGALWAAAAHAAAGGLGCAAGLAFGRSAVR